jgi:hypothetical protein
MFTWLFAGEFEDPKRLSVRELNMIADVRGGTPRWTLAKEGVRKTKRAQRQLLGWRCTSFQILQYGDV